MVDIPATMNEGRRARRFFSSEVEALRASSEIAVSHRLGKIALPSDGDRIRDLAARFLAEKKHEVRKDTLRQLTWAVGLLTDKFGDMSPGDLSPTVIKAWHDRLGLKTRGAFNAFACCRSFFNWHGVREICRENPFYVAPPRQDKDARLPILTPDQMKELLAADWPQWFRNWMVCGAFAGIRTIECLRLSHSAIDWEYKEILIRKDESKQGEAAKPRAVSILPAFERHMKEGQKGKIMEGYTEKRMRRCYREGRKILSEDKWLKNVLRHSFASYHLAHFRDAAKTSLEMGHESPRMLWNTYANLVSRRDAEKWWNL
jgi:integrase